MKSRLFFKFLFCLTIVIIVAGCSVYKYPQPPARPKVTSQIGKACLKDCEAIHDNCVDACSKTRQTSQREKCFDNCNKKLGDCYSTCE